jgi:hypothetical protein
MQEAVLVMRRSDSNARRPNERFCRPDNCRRRPTGTVAQAHGASARDPRTRRSVQQRSTATTARSNTFGFIQMCPGQREQGYKQLLRGVRDEEVAGSNPATPTTVLPCQSGIPRSVRELLPGLSDQLSDSRRIKG